MADVVRKVWQAFAVGDAMGMPSEFMLPEDIRAAVGGLPDGLMDPKISYTHGDLPFASVTDDTEQNAYLLETFRREGAVTPGGVVDALKRWIRETAAVEKHYIGPSSLKALQAIDDGLPVEQAGLSGTTCGAIMRTPAAVLWKPEQSEEELEAAIHTACLPTHNTSEALESAGAYGFALACALHGGSMEEIYAAAERGGRKLMARAPWISAAPSSLARIRAGRTLGLEEEDLCRYLYELWGTGLPSADVCGAVFALFAVCGKDAWRAIRLASVLGGDTDTIGALVGALCTAYAGGHSIPEPVVEAVREANRPLFEAKLPEVLE